MNNECPICLEEIDSTSKKLMYCDHMFHEKCIDNWKVVNNSCPVCREPINKVFECKILYNKKYYPAQLSVKDGVFGFKTKKKLDKLKQSFKFNYQILKSFKKYKFFRKYKRCYGLNLTIGTERLVTFYFKFDLSKDMLNCAKCFIFQINKYVTDDLKISI